MIQAEYGFIGCGNMGGAIARVLCKTVDPKRVLLSNRTPAKAEALAKELGCQAGDNLQAAQCAYIFLGVKPHLMADMLGAIRTTLAARAEPPVLVSMAAGLTIAQIQEMAGQDYPVIRIMPNTPVAVGQGAVLYKASANATQEMVNGFLGLMSKAGKLFPIDESLMDVGAAVSGCGPAYAYLVLDAMADGGVACGLPRPDAVRYAAQTLLGAVQMVLETGKHPDQLKNEVCSPGGSTIQGVRTLEQHGVRAAVMDAVIAACEKNAALGK